jgi:hypothetical protein
VSTEEDLDAFLEDGARKPSPDERFKKTIDEVVVRMGSGDWTDTRPMHFVAMFALLHHRVYGVEAHELTTAERVRASTLAGHMLREHFGDDAGAMAAYVRWAWQREKQRETWRRTNARTGGRLMARFVFGGALLTDYHLDLARRHQQR